MDYIADLVLLRRLTAISNSPTFLSSYSKATRSDQMATIGIQVHTDSIGVFPFDDKEGAKKAFKALEEDGWVVSRNACSVDETQEDKSYQSTILHNEVRLRALERKSGGRLKCSCGQEPTRADNQIFRCQKFYWAQ
ncbi:hypothetical protein GP486_000242 [Trichoglossum hirsutum]|uniref:Uncharacterized protein n=1 Tax=Trichoglossum hirsutum TaxID=265104 RepID=A0A9P8RU67_9PEZI|nr:hypothetical protein GP486_000242 [Trichoglossum hirsutum]